MLTFALKGSISELPASLFLNLERISNRRKGYLCSELTCCYSYSDNRDAYQVDNEPKLCAPRILWAKAEGGGDSIVLLRVVCRLQLMHKGCVNGSEKEHW